jgi:hypothetical protein
LIVLSGCGGGGGGTPSPKVVVAMDTSAVAGTYDGSFSTDAEAYYGTYSARLILNGTGGGTIDVSVSDGFYDSVIGAGDWYEKN